MSVEQLIFALVSAAGVIVGGFWGVSKLAMAQFSKRLDERFAGFSRELHALKQAGDERLRKLESRYEALDQDVRRILIELPREYVARADYVRRETIIEGKVDQLRLILENVQLKGGRQ